MLNHQSRMWFLGSCWFAAVLVIVGTSMTVGASLSTSALLFVVCAAPMAVLWLIGFGAPPPTVAEVLYAADAAPDARWRAERLEDR